MLFEVGEKGVRGEMLEARGVIGHGVLRSWDVGHLLAVAMVSLVMTCEVTEVRCGSVAGDRPLGETGDGRGVVGARPDGGVGGLVVSGQDVQLGEDSRLL